MNTCLIRISPLVACGDGNFRVPKVQKVQAGDHQERRLEYLRRHLAPVWVQESLETDEDHRQSQHKNQGIIQCHILEENICFPPADKK